MATGNKSGSKTASTATSTGAATTASGKKKYATVILGCGGARAELKAKVDALAVGLGCRFSDLMWAGAQHLVDNPPKTAPAGASRNVGKSAGFWVLHTMKDGRLVGATVQEVAAKGQVDGGDRLFLRYSDGDAKGRARARANAIKAATYDLGLAGVSKAPTVKDLA